MATAIEVVAPPLIAIAEVFFVFANVSGQPASNRPDAASIERFSKHRIGHQSRDAAIAVHERVYPQ